MSRRSCSGSAFRCHRSFVCVRPSRCPRHGGSAVASSPSLSSGHQPCQSSPTPSSPDHRRAGRLASGAARPPQFRIAASHTRRCPSRSPRSASSSSVCRHGWDLLGGATHDRSRRSDAAATSDLFQNTLPQWCCIARHFEGQESFQEVIMGFWAPQHFVRCAPIRAWVAAKNARERSFGLSSVIRNRTGVCRERRALESPKYLGLPRRFRNAFMPRRIPGGSNGRRIADRSRCCGLHPRHIGVSRAGSWTSDERP